jgi:DnaK suppressor protein
MPASKKTAEKLAVKSDEKPWTAKELGEVRDELNSDRDRLRSELNLAEVELAGLMRDAGDGAGNDQADVGSTTFERDHEMTLANNAREMLAQTEHALERIEDGSYGACESSSEAR